MLCTLYNNNIIIIFIAKIKKYYTKRERRIIERSRTNNVHSWLGNAAASELVPIPKNWHTNWFPINTFEKGEIQSNYICYLILLFY
jgi:hypothetical protein